MFKIILLYVEITPESRKEYSETLWGTEAALYFLASYERSLK